MKKIIILLLICSLFFLNFIKFSNRNRIETIIEEKDNMLISINYPKTSFGKLDELIFSYIDEKYTNFKNEYNELWFLASKSEMNIDYTYKLVSDRYINITLHTYINSNNLENSISEIYTIIYDKVKSKIIELKDIIDEKNLNIVFENIKLDINNKYESCISKELLNSKISKNYNSFDFYTFDSKNLYIYFNPNEFKNNNCDVINIKIPLSKITTKINIEEKETFKTESYETSKNISLDPNKPVVALTFDDGPSNYTDEILDVLYENNASATFFVLGNKVEIYNETIKKMVRNGNEIGNHSYNHRWLTRLSLDQLNDQIDKTQNIVKDITGYTPKILRPTYGSVNKKLRNNVDLKIVLWDVDTMDWKIKNSKKIASRTINSVSDKDIILMHDTYERTLKAVKIIVPELIKQGYQFVTISELEEIKKLRQKDI